MQISGLYIVDIYSSWIEDRNENRAGWFESTLCNTANDRRLSAVLQFIQIRPL